MMDAERPKSKLKIRQFGIKTYKESVIYMRDDCHVCRAEGFEVQTRVNVELNGKSIIATLNLVTTDILQQGEASLSEFAMLKLGASVGDDIFVSHPAPLSSLSFMRSKIYGNKLKKEQFKDIISDIVAGHYSDIHISSFLTACAGGRLNQSEIISLTQAMVESGDKIDWGKELIVDKHCVGGLPGNRTTPIVVAIVAAHGLIMPKTSSRAITSPAGTADTMEVLAPVVLDINTMKKVVESEGGCVVWGGSVTLSPADDLLIRVEKALDLDGEGQLVASILSKKIAAGASHVLIDIPVGPTAKIRALDRAQDLTRFLEQTGSAMGLGVRAHTSDGLQPVGYGIGPALEARDLIAVLQNSKDAPIDLRERALDLSGHILEFSSQVENGSGRAIASQILNSGKAWDKFKNICNAQGGMRDIPSAKFTHVITSTCDGVVKSINNRSMSRLAKLAGAPSDKVAGVDLHIHIDDILTAEQPLFTVHADSPGELEYALSYLKEQNNIINISRI
jgi:thymidine phosphorylase